MEIFLPISEETERALRQQAAEAGVSPEALAARVVERSVRTIEELRRITDPIRKAVEASGMSEDEIVEVFEAEKHAMRAERRKKAS